MLTFNDQFYGVTWTRRCVHMAWVRHPDRYSSREQNQSRLDTEGTRQGGRGAPQAGVWSHSAEPSKQVSFRSWNSVFQGSVSTVKKQVMVCGNKHRDREERKGLAKLVSPALKLASSKPYLLGWVGYSALPGL